MNQNVYKVTRTDRPGYYNSTLENIQDSASEILTNPNNSVKMSITNFSARVMEIQTPKSKFSKSQLRRAMLSIQEFLN